MNSTPDLKLPLHYAAAHQAHDDKLIAELEWEAPQSVQQHRKAKRWWKVLAAAALGLYVTWRLASWVSPYGYIFHGRSPSFDLSDVDNFDPFDGVRAFHTAELDEDGPHRPHHPHHCIAWNPEHDNLAPFLYNISTKPDRIGIISRGPIAGNVTFVEGGTAGDDVEVEVTILPWKKPDPPEGDHAEESHPHPHPPHGPPSPPGLALCEFLTEDGDVQAVGLFAHPPRCHRHGPPPPRGPHGHPLPGYPHPTDTPSPGGHPFEFAASISGVGGKSCDGKHCHSRRGSSEKTKDWSRPPHYPPHRPPPVILANVVVRFPKKAVIESFGSGLRFFKYDIGKLDAVTFREFKLLSVHHPVNVESVSASVVKIVSLGGGVAANVAVTESLELVSTGRPAFLNATLISASHEKPFNATKLSIVGAHAPIHANVALASPSKDSGTYSPAYVVKTANKFSPTFLNFTAQPLSSTLFVESVSTKGELVASLASEYEGSFELVDIGRTPLVNVTEGVEDPSGEGRKRAIDINKKWWSLSGTVSWVKDDLVAADMLGHVKLVSTFAPITLVL